MPLLGHLPELIVVLLIGLLVFGPKRMIEMGSSVGKAVREMRESLKDIPGIGGNGLQSLLGQDEPLHTPFVATHAAPPAPVTATSPSTVAAASESSAEQPRADERADNAPAVPSSPAPSDDGIVEGTVERVVETRES